MSEKLLQAMSDIADMNKAGKAGTEKLKGKTYTKVSARVEVFRQHLGEEYGIETAPLFPAGGGMFMQAWIKNKNGFVLGTGHAYTTKITQEKGVEKLETTAIGRALASIGLAGGEYASDTEMESWQERYAPSINPVDKTGDKETDNKWKEVLAGIRDYPKQEGATVVGIDDRWNKLQYSEKFQQYTEEQQGILNDQYDSSREQIERKVNE